MIENVLEVKKKFWFFKKAPISGWKRSLLNPQVKCKLKHFSVCFFLTLEYTLLCSSFSYIFHIAWTIYPFFKVNFYIYTCNVFGCMCVWVCTPLCLTLFHPMDCSPPGKNTEAGCHALLQGIFLTQGLNLCLLPSRQILDHWPMWETQAYQSVQFSSVQSFSHVWLFATTWTSARQASLSITSSQSLLKLMSIELVIPSNQLNFCHPLLLLLSIFPSIRVFSSESALPIRWPKYWSFSFNISPTNEHPGLISFRMDWLDLPAVQGTLKNLLQHHSSKASVLPCSAFFIVQLSHPYMTTGKTIVLNRWTFVGKVMSLLFNMLSRLVITFLPKSKSLFISWLQSPSAVILEPKKIKSATVSPSFVMEWWDWMPWS